MSLPKVFVTRIIPPEAQEILNRVAEIEIWPQDTKPPQEIIIKIDNNKVIFVNNLYISFQFQSIQWNLI